MINADLNLAAIILAAGFGERMKALGAKPLLRYHNKSFLETVVTHSVDSGLKPVIVVTNKQFFPEMQAISLPVQFVINKHPEQGMLSSIKLALNFLPESCPGFLMCPVDFPLISQNTFRLLADSFAGNSNSIIKPIYQSKGGHPIIFPRSLFNELKSAPLNEGARYVTRKFSHQIKYVPVDDPAILLNINTPEMYEQYCK